MKKREFVLGGTKIEVFNFGYASFMYPSFNGNAEFKTTGKGFRQLSSYIRTVNYFRNQLNKHL